MLLHYIRDRKGILERYLAVEKQIMLRQIIDYISKNFNKFSVVVLLLLFYPLFAYSASVVDIVVKQRVIVAQKRGIVTLPFTVVNRSNKPYHFIENIDLPEGWRVLANAGAFTLAAGETRLRLVHVLASSDVPAGKYIIPYEVVSRDNLAIRAERNISVIIKSSSKLSVEVVDQPDLVLAGEQYTAKVLVENKGNVPLSLAVKLKDTSSYRTSFEPRHLNLKPSQEATVTITVNIPSSLKESSIHTLQLSLKGNSVSVDKTIKTQIISYTSEGIGLYHSIPTKVTTTYTSNKENGILQTEIAAVGLLDEKGKHHLDLLYRDTKTNTVSSLGSDSEKRLSYHNNSLGFHLGDHTFSLKGITSEGYYGKGIEIDYHPEGKNWNIRAFTAQHQQDNDEGDNFVTNDVSGFEVGYRFSRYLKLIVNTLSLESNENSQPKEEITGVELRWNKYSAAEINLSLAKDHDGSAFRLQQDGKLGVFNYDLEIQNADAAFDGYIKDIKSESITGVISFNDNKNYFRANLYHAKHNLDEDNSKRILEEKNFRLGVGHSFNNSHRDSLYTELFIRQTKDLRKQADHNKTEQGLRFDYQKTINQKLRMNTVLEHVIINNKMTKRKTDENRGSLTLAYTPNEKYNFGFNIDSTQVNNNTLINTDHSLGYGLNGTVRFNSRQFFSGYWRHSGNSNSLQLNYNHILNNGITIGASVSTDSLNSNSNNLDYLLKLTIPFDTPLYKYKNIGSLKGNIYNKNLQQPVSNAIVGVAGQFAVTDENGNYQFKTIRAGEYEFTTNLTKTKLNNYLIENQQRQTATLIANKLRIHNVNLVPGTGVTGQILSYTASRGSVLQGKKDEMKVSGGVKSLLVTLISSENNEVVHKMLTSEGGFFNFNGIKAGKWLIQVTDPQQVIKDARMENPQRIIDLKVGEEKNMLFKTIPLIKIIRKVGPSNGFNVSGE